MLLECIDNMIGHIIKCLWNSHSNNSVAIVITGDHSTPVMFGDHSNEPVPFCISYLHEIVNKYFYYR